MGQKAKLFKAGGSQAVRLPKAYRFEGQSEVIVRRQGDCVVLEPIRRTWSEQFLALAGSSEDFPYVEDDMMADPGPDLG